MFNLRNSSIKKWSVRQPGETQTSEVLLINSPVTSVITSGKTFLSSKSCTIAPWLVRKSTIAFPVTPAPTTATFLFLRVLRNDMAGYATTHCA
ncbi:unannotated protein [freshwater metagenome]|uniref:Unannotated protein n=1 Tax=freshwater metagenome TaxID=449393 RepID=A0A6J7UB90_9ZZZZ